MQGLEYMLAEEFTFGINMTFNHLKGRIRQKQMVELDTRELKRIRLGQRIFTRREALSFVCGNIDPLGYISPVLLTGRLLLQRLYGDLEAPGTRICRQENRISGWGGFKTWQRRQQSS